MLRKLILILLSILISITIVSCNHAAQINTINTKLPRRGFLFFKKSVTLHQCNKKKCSSLTSRSVASGFIVKIKEKGSFAITAAHVCETAVRPTKPPIKAIASYLAITTDGRQYEAKVLSYDSEIDVCMLFIKNLNQGVEEVIISPGPPAIGEKIYNYAAPRGLFRPGMVVLLEGRFNGNSGGVAWYTLPAAPGSSGSMIVNIRGELVGMLHSVYVYFPMIALSTKYSGLRHFIEHNLGKHTNKFWIAR